MKENSIGGNVLAADNLSTALEGIVESLSPSGVYLLTDSTVDEKVMPLLSGFVGSVKPEKIVVPAGEASKNISSLCEIWNRMSFTGGSRSSLLINVGGGMITDLGGFAAACFKRGIRFVNLPTTVLGAVDAAVGGKTGIDFNGFKNEVGAFALSEAVLVSSAPLATLPEDEILSGYAEMVKTAAITSAGDYSILLNAERVISDPKLMQEMMRRVIVRKVEVTTADPKESGLRRILNFGHTMGHAFESVCIEKGSPVSHGFAVAHGMLSALILSHILLGLPSAEIYRYADFLKENYPRLPLGCKDFARIYEIMGHDKKNRKAGEPLFCLLKEIGSPVFDIAVSRADADASIDIYRDLLGM